MDTEYRKHYRDLFQRHWWWRARTEFLVHNLKSMLPRGRGINILDVGCGEGLFFDRLSEFGHVDGIEVEGALPVDSPWLDRISIRPFDETFRPDKRYSLILMLDVLEHLADPGAALRNVRRLLAADGLFLATVPAFQAAWTNHDVLNQHVRRYTKTSLGRLLEDASLKVLQQRYFFYWAFLAKLAVRGRERLFPRKPEVPVVPAGWINETLFGVSRLEQKLLGRLPMPFGSSLMAVAKMDREDS